MNQNELTIDLSKEKFNFSTIPNLHEITEIRFDNYTDKIEIPVAINDYPNITELSFSGKENSYQTLDNLDKCIYIKKLTLWNYCDFTQMKPMPNLEKLNVVVQNTESDTRNIITVFPNLKHLEIDGKNLKNQNLPEEIENLASLQSLDLESCGLNNLPNSFTKLKQLKELNLKGLHFDIFPEEITHLENLEILEIRQPLSNLPDSLSNLKKLKKLNLYYALNGGNMDVAGALRQENLYLKPIPDVIGTLLNLEDLNLGICGVFDITPIISLKKLKKLNLLYSALKNCDGFSNFTMLEELDLESSYDLKKLEGLKGLPLKKLSISSNYNKSINVISSLELLENLNIEGCRYIKDFSPLYNHTGIKELNADSEIIKKWKKRAEYNKLPTISVITEQLKTDNLQQLEEAIYHLSKQVKANYSNHNNPLAGYFDVEIEEEEITEIEVLDSAIQKHLKNLSDKTLLTIFGMTFKSVISDNYNASLLVLEEIVARKNVETQQQIIKKFYKASKYYARHRFWSDTVHDQLIDTFFAEFTSEALYNLLKEASTDMLNRKSGAGMDELFIPAFENTTDIGLQEKLLIVFLEYEKNARAYFGKEYFGRLLQRIEESASPELEKLILTKKEEGKEQEEWFTALENLNEENLPGVIETIRNKNPENWNDQDLDKIIEASKQIALDENSIENLLDFMAENKKNHYLEEILISKYHPNTPEKSIDFLKTRIEKGFFKSGGAFLILKNIIIKLTRLNVPVEGLKIYEDFAVSYCNVSFDTVYNIETETLLNNFFNHKSYFPEKDISWVLEKLKTVIEKTGEPKFQDLDYNTGSLLRLEEYEKAKQVFYVLYPKVMETKDQKVLFYNISVSIKLNDEPYFDIIFNEVQQLQKLDNVLLAYNLATALAHFGRKEEMLIYIEESIRLGKMKQQFMDDADFEKYWSDADFLKAIEKK